VIAQIRSELLKLRTTRTVPILVLAGAAVSLLGVAVEGISRDAVKLVPELQQRDLLSKGVTIGVFIAAVAGILVVTSEYRYGTIRPTLLVQPRRGTVLGAKLVAAAVAGVLFATVCVATSFAAWAIVLGTRGIPAQLTAGHAVTLVLGPVGASALSAMIGVAVGSLVRNQVGAVVGLALYALVIDAGLFAAAPSIGRLLPGKAGDAIAGRPTDQLLSPGIALAVLALWTLAMIVAALRHDRHADV
jgi:ABC-2 type transport system permease protein